MTENNAFYKRIDDLSGRAERRGIVTKTAFLTPAEQYALRQYYRGENLVLTGGQPDCERQMAFFLPPYAEPDDLDISEHIRAIRIETHFGTPGHRDYLGAALGLGVKRESLGDLRIRDNVAYAFCMPAVETLLSDELKKVGRFGVTVSPCAFGDVPLPTVRVRTVSFTVKSLRLDTVTGEIFGLSRTAAAEAIRMGGVHLNYVLCEKVDAPVKEGDVLSLRGHGKGRLKTVGGLSRKGRLFIDAELFL